MGIHLSSIAQINAIDPKLNRIRYFVYLINYYNIDDAVIEELLASVPTMNAEFSKFGNTVSVSTIKNLDFANDSLSWDNCFGVDAGEVCPAILICTLPPFYFLPGLLTPGTSRKEGVEQDVPWVLLSLKDRGKNIEELRQIIQMIVKEFAMGSDISQFNLIRILHTIDRRPVLNADVSGADSSLSRREIFERLGDA